MSIRSKNKSKFPYSLVQLLMLALLLPGCAGMPRSQGETGSVAKTELLAWVDTELVPYLGEQFTQHPRFKGEPVFLVSMSGADINAQIDELSKDIRARLMDGLLTMPGVKLMWRPTMEPWQHDRTQPRLHCHDISRVHYYVGMEVTQTTEGGYRVSVRALDLEQRSWVAGFGKQWRGHLTQGEQLALQRRNTDEYLRGLRMLPFTASQRDLLAAYLSRNLSCLLREEGRTGLAVYPVPYTQSTLVRDLNELVGRYLARIQQVRITDDVQQADTRLRIKEHEIHEGLYQFWVELRAREPSKLSVALHTAAYMQLDRDGDMSAVHSISVTDPHPIKVQTLEPLLPSFKLIAPRGRGQCADAWPWRYGERALSLKDPISPEQCFSLELKTARDARVFLLHHRVDGELVRLMPPSCTGDDWGEFKPGNRGLIRFPGQGSALQGWAGGAGASLETFYAIAVRGDEAVRPLAMHLRRLPGRCEKGVGTGLSGSGLDSWLTELDIVLDDLGGQVQWKALRIGHADQTHRASVR